MKLQIVKTDDEKIENYQHIQCYGTPLDLSSIADNECEEILAGDLLDMYTLICYQLVLATCKANYGLEAGLCLEALSFLF